MRLTLRLFGLTVLDVEASTEDQVEVTEGAELAGGTTSAYPIGFCASAGDQAWEAGVER